MASFWRSNIPRINAVMERERPRALIVTAQVLINEVKRRLAGGYTSGAFVTGNSVNHVTRTEPYREDDGWGIKVGTNLLYDLFWELGHHNIFTRRYERVEVWVPAFYAVMQDMIDTHAAYLRARLAELE